MIGEYSSGLHFFENTGTPISPAFSFVQTNPFGITSYYNFNAPRFADTDNDGDQELYVGKYGEVVFYFENTGISTSPTFAAPQWSNLGQGRGGFIVPAFSYFDNDGDLDALTGRKESHLVFHQNIGTPSNPYFWTEEVDLPFSINPIGYFQAPTLVDIDGDVVAFCKEALTENSEAFADPRLELVRTMLLASRAAR